MTIDCSRDPVEAAIWLARAFTAGRHLCVWASDAPDHAHHVAVEFVHPVVAGTRPLAARVAESAARVAESDAARVVEFAARVAESRSAAAAHTASEVVLVVGDEAAGADLFIASRLSEPEIVRSYHVLWELVQVVLEHPGVAGGNPTASGDSTGFLYPFLDAADSDEVALRQSLQSSADAKAAESEQLAHESLKSNQVSLAAVSDAISRAAATGRRVLTMGNGGSASDAARLVRLLRHQGIAAEALCADYAVATALANDLGAERVFSRQLDAFAQRGDVLMGCSTSGTSRNLLTAFEQADSAGLVTVGLSGYGGGAFIDDPSVHHSLVVESLSVHRIQEAQAALMSDLCKRVSAATKAITATKAATVTEAGAVTGTASVSSTNDATRAATATKASVTS